MPAAPTSASPRDEPSVRERLRRSFLTGTALLIPLVLTLVVLQIALDLISQVVSPIVAGVELVFGAGLASELALEVVTVATLGALVMVTGFAAERRSGPGRLSGGFDALMARVPGLGSVYTGIRRMSEVLLEGENQSFREVKLVEFPREGAFMLAFLTAEPPAAVRDAAGADEMLTLFVPLAPNPVMGGFLVHVPSRRVRDVDLTVEEGVQSVVTSGAAVDPRVDGVDVGTGLADAATIPDGLFDSAVFDVDLLPGDDDAGRDGR